MSSLTISKDNTQDSKELWLCFQQICPQPFAHHNHMLSLQSPWQQQPFLSNNWQAHERTVLSQGSWAPNICHSNATLMLTTLKTFHAFILTSSIKLRGQNSLMWTKQMEDFAVLFSHAFLFESPQSCLCWHSLLVDCATKLMQKAVETEADSHH